MLINYRLVIGVLDWCFVLGGRGPLDRSKPLSSTGRVSCLTGPAEFRRYRLFFGKAVLSFACDWLSSICETNPLGRRVPNVAP